MRVLLSTLGMVAALLSCGAAAGGQEKPKPKVHTVTMAEMRFTPQALTVARGDIILFVNKDLVPHSATSPKEVFDSKTIEAGRTWRYVPAERGVFPYVCTFHPTMTGTLRVK